MANKLIGKERALVLAQMATAINGQEHHYEEHYNLGRTHFLTDELRGVLKSEDVPNSDKFEHAADLLTLTRTPFDWREANVAWLANRKFFPKNLSRVKFA